MNDKLNMLNSQLRLLQQSTIRGVASEHEGDADADCKDQTLVLLKNKVQICAAILHCPHVVDQ